MTISAAGWMEYFTERFEALSAPSSLRKEAWRKFLSQGLPTRNCESFHYFPCRSFLNDVALQPQEIRAEEVLAYAVLPECRNSFIVLVDGKFRKDLSCVEGIPPQVVLIPLEGALTGSYSAYIKHRFVSGLEKEQDPFACLNGALFSGGVFVYVPPEVECPLPIQCIEICSNGTMSRAHLFLGARSRITWVSSTLGSGFHHSLLDMALEEGARLEHAAVSEEESSWGFHTVRLTQKKESEAFCSRVSTGGKGARYDYQIALMGSHASAELSGLSLLEDKKHAHMHVQVEHRAPHCRSKQLFKTVQSGTSVSSFCGKIYVEDVAQKTEAYQLHRSLLLSDYAQANSKPSLEIFADDVKASHGATVSQLDPNEIFYLRTRGISSELAQSFLTAGFCREVIQNLPVAALRQEAVKKTSQFFGRIYD